MRTPSLFRLCALAASLPVLSLHAQTPEREARDLNGYFPFKPVKDAKEWTMRRQEVQTRLQVASGLWPMPDKTPLNAVIHGRVERDDYTIDRVYFESLPGHYVTGSLYLPKKRPARMPGILCPHGHWPNGRFMDLGAGSEAAKKQIDTGAEKLENAARSPLQARCVQLARMGCAAFLYDTLGNADSIQFPEHRHGATKDGFVSAAADLSLQTYFGLQTWNSIRALDFLLSLEGIDPTRIGCTGASGGGTQTMMVTGLDDRIVASHPCVMVSTAMQGGCTCENSHYLRINQGNIDIAALTAPRPLGLTAADDWTKEIETKGLPDLKALYAMLGKPENITAHIATQFPHNYNLPSRLAMYSFFNKHFNLGLTEPVEEKDFVFSTPEDVTVWTKDHPKPSGDKVGEAHERAVRAWMSAQDKKHIARLLEGEKNPELRKVIGTAWSIMIGRRPPSAKNVAFDLGKKEEKNDYILMDGVTTYTPKKESVTATFLYPKNWKGEAVLWLSLKGPQSIWTSDGPTPAAKKLLDAGLAIACPTLYLPDAKESPKFGDNLKAKENDFREFSGYTYGYNPSLFARRVHDAMMMVSMMRSHPTKAAKKVYLAGSEGAGPIAAAAGALLRNRVQSIALDLQGFRFEKLTSPWDINFIPGAVKYGDVDALLKLCGTDKVVEAKGSEAVASALAK